MPTEETTDASDNDTDMFNFGTALALLKEGKHVSREGWNGKDMYLFLEEEKDYKETVLLAHIVMKTVQNTFVPWLASQTDLLSEDWMLVT